MSVKKPSFQEFDEATVGEVYKALFSVTNPYHRQDFTTQQIEEIHQALFGVNALPVRAEKMAELHEAYMKSESNWL